MPAPLSIIVPTLNAAAVLPGCTAALMEGIQAGLVRELIVSDGGSDDATLVIAEEIGARIVTGPASRGGQLKRGCEIAQGDWFLVVHADTLLAAGWTQAVKNHMRTNRAGWGTLRFDQGGIWVARWANLRSRLFGLPFGDQALLVPASLYQSVGGFPDQPLMEDIAIARKLRGKLAPASFVAVTSAAKYRKGGWLRRGGRNLLLQARYLLGASPEKLAADYRRK